MRYSKRILSSEKGFILILAIMACVILFALAMLVINLSTSDLRVSSKNVGEKKALTAAETGIHRMIQNFDPQNLASTAATSVQVDASNDPASVYTIGTPATPANGPVFLPMIGYAIGGGQTWGQRCFVVDVEGRNTAYVTQVTIRTGVGYGPVEISTIYK
ncbi:MAG: pilus assembly PilX N-terminal domain-containing protein [Deltaproteobacteria bacterium]